MDPINALKAAFAAHSADRDQATAWDIAATAAVALADDPTTDPERAVRWGWAASEGYYAAARFAAALEWARWAHLPGGLVAQAAAADMARQASVTALAAFARAAAP